MKILALAVFLLLIVPNTVYSQYIYHKVSVSIDVKVEAKLLSLGYLTGKTVGFEGNPSENYGNFENLLKIATKRELIELTNHPNGIVRCYAFWGVLRTDTSDAAVTIFRNHLLDIEEVTTFFGCLSGGKMKVNEFYHALVVDTDIVKKFTVEDYKKIHQPFPPENYENLRKAASNTKDYEFLVELAKYQKQQDIKMIADLFLNPQTVIWGLRAIKFFPDTAFLPFLKSIEGKLDKKPYHFDPEISLYYKVLVQYHSDWITKKLEKEIRNKYLQGYILYAFKRFPDCKYTYLKTSVKQKHPDKNDQLNSPLFLFYD